MTAVGRKRRASGAQSSVSLRPSLAVADQSSAGPELSVCDPARAFKRAAGCLIFKAIPDQLVNFRPSDVLSRPDLKLGLRGARLQAHALAWAGAWTAVKEIGPAWHRLVLLETANGIELHASDGYATNDWITGDRICAEALILVEPSCLINGYEEGRRRWGTVAAHVFENSLGKRKLTCLSRSGSQKSCAKQDLCKIVHGSISQNDQPQVLESSFSGSRRPWVSKIAVIGLSP